MEKNCTVTCTLQSLILTQDWTLNWIDNLIQDKEYIVQSFEISSMFRTAVYFFFPTCQALKAWCEISRVNFYRNHRN